MSNCVTISSRLVLYSGTSSLQRLRRDHHAGGVHRAVARQAFQAQRHLEDFVARAGLSWRASSKPGSCCDGVGERDVEDVGHHLGEALHVGERHLQHAAHVLDGGARAQRVEGDDLRHLLAAVFFGDVLDHFAAAVHAEIDVDIGHADALRVEEALEQQAVLQRVDIGDRHGVAHQAAGRRAAPRPHRNAVRFGVADEVPDDQEVAGELHLLDHLDFAIQALGVFGEVVLQSALGAHGFQARAALFEALPRDVFEVGVGGVAFRHVEFRERLLHLFQLDVAALGDLPGAVERVLQLAEQLHHLVARLQVEIGRVPAHAVGIAHRSCRSGCTAGFRARARPRARR